VHELLGIKNNVVDMKSVPAIRKDMREIVLSPEQDNFYRGSMYLNFGDLGASIKDLVETYQRQTKTTTKLDSIEDMQRFVENYPQFRQMSGNVSKHVAVMTEVSRTVDRRDLMEIAKVEQDLACQQEHATALENVLRILEDEKLAFEDKLRVVGLYALRYESEAQSVTNVKAILRTKAKTDEQRQRSSAIDELLGYAGVKHRSGDLFGNKSFFSKASKFISSGLKGVENVFAQHRPLLIETLEAVIKQKLKVQTYPFIDAKDGKVERHDEVFVYMVGGVTFEEALHMQLLAESKDNSTGIKFVLGGSAIHNSTTFLDDVLGWPANDTKIDIRAASSATATAAAGGSARYGGGGGGSSSASATGRKPADRSKFNG